MKDSLLPLSLILTFLISTFCSCFPSSSRPNSDMRDWEYKRYFDSEAGVIIYAGTICNPTISAIQVRKPTIKVEDMGDRKIDTRGYLWRKIDKENGVVIYEYCNPQVFHQICGLAAVKIAKQPSATP